jgi:hypothetical protein
MVETAHRWYETFSQRGEPALTMMQSILKKMLPMPMDFKVAKVSAEFATEAYIHHMCTVADLIKTCCFEGAAYDLVTNKLVPRKVRRAEGSADKPGCREGAAPIHGAGSRCAKRKIPTTS